MGWSAERRGICNDEYAEYNDRQNIKQGGRVIIASFGEVAAAFATKTKILKTALSNRGVEITKSSDGLTSEDIVFLAYHFDSKAKIEILREAEWFKTVCYRFSKTYRRYQCRLGSDFDIDYNKVYAKKR